MHEVDIEEVEDEIDDEILPPTQLPAKKRGTRSSSTKRPAAAAAAATPSKRSQSVSGAPSDATKKSVGGKRSSQLLTQKRKDNISSSFLTSLANKGISEEMQKSER